MKYAIFAALCLLYSFVTGINAQQRCCFAKQFSMNMKQMTGQAKSNQQALFTQNATWFHDAINMKQAWNGTTYANGQAFHSHIIWDFSKKMRYDIDPARKRCQTSAITDPMLTCIPADAKFVGSGILGDNTKVNGWSYSGNPKGTQTIAFVTDPDCVLTSTSQVLLRNSNEMAQMVAIAGFNFKKGVNQSAFTVPSYCS